LFFLLFKQSVLIYFAFQPLTLRYLIKVIPLTCPAHLIWNLHVYFRWIVYEDCYWLCW